MRTDHGSTKGVNVLLYDKVFGHIVHYEIAL